MLALIEVHRLLIQTLSKRYRRYSLSCTERYKFVRAKLRESFSKQLEQIYTYLYLYLRYISKVSSPTLRTFLSAGLPVEPTPPCLCSTCKSRRRICPVQLWTACSRWPQQHSAGCRCSPALAAPQTPAHKDEFKYSRIRTFECSVQLLFKFN